MELNKVWESKVSKLRKHCLLNGWVGMMSTVCTVNFQIGLIKQTKIVSEPWLKNILQRRNPFNLEQPKGIMNVATGAVLEKDEEDFIINWNFLTKAARNDFYESRLEVKKIQLLETISNTVKRTQKKSEKKKWFG